MGNHYVPQAYLRRFSADPKGKTIWMFDKVTQRFLCASISSVAQQNAFYSEQVESQLNALVERPANRVLAKIIGQEAFTEEDRRSLAIYIATMMKRIPRLRRKAVEMIPKVLTDTVEEIKETLKRMARETPAKGDLVLRKLGQLDEIRRRFEAEPPQEMIEQIRTPWASQKMIAALYSMTWRFISAREPDFFITSDNPAFFFEAFGLLKEEAELTFPIAPSLALHGSWQGQTHSALFLETRPALVKEINRRLISGAERFVFSHLDANWIPKLATKKQIHLNQITW